MTERALDAAAALAARGIAAGVLHVPTIKPFDADAVADFAASVRRLVTAENHVVIGGLASLVVEALFDARASLAGHPDRPARPLHRVRLGADAAGPLRPHDGEAIVASLPRERPR